MKTEKRINSSPNLPNVWIIGASSGIGKALAIKMAKQGYLVALSGRNETELVRLHEHISQYLPPNKDENIDIASSHLVVPCDVAEYENLQYAKDAILSKWSTIHRVIFMAGIYEPMLMHEMDITRLNRVIQTNLNAAFYLSNLVLPHLLNQSINTSSDRNSISKSSLSGSSTTLTSSSISHLPPQLIFCASVAGYIGLPNGQPYSATKAALINFAESLRAEYDKQVDIKIISPGFVETRLTDKNTFKMPMIITAEEAADMIMREINQRNRFEIHFPKRFTTIMKTLRVLPYWLFFRLTKKIRQ